MSTDQYVERLKRRQTKTLTYQNIDWPKRRHTKTSTNQNKPKRRLIKISTDQIVETPKRRQTETWTVQVSTLYSRVFVFIILGMYYICMTGGMYFIYQYQQLYNYWGFTLHISTSNIKSIVGGIPGIILKVKDHFERLTINTDVCTEVV